MILFNRTSLVLVVIVCAAAIMPGIRDKINNTAAAKRFEGIVKLLTGRYFNLALIMVLLIGAAVRLWKFGLIPGGFNQDGAMGAVDALALADHGTDRFGMWLPVHFTAWGFGQMSVLLSYLSVPFISLFGLNRFTARIAILIVSLLALWVLYMLVLLLAGRNAALAVLAFCAVDPWHIMQSRWALDCNMLPHFLLFAFYFLYLGIKKKRVWLYISMLFFGLSMYAYGIAWYSVPLLLLITAIYLLKKRQLSLMGLLPAAFVYFIVSWPIFGVMVINYFKLPTMSTPFFTIPLFPDTTRTADILFFSGDFSAQLYENFLSFVNVVLLQKPDLLWNTIPEFGSLYLFAIPLALLGGYALFRMNKDGNKKGEKDGNKDGNKKGEKDGNKDGENGGISFELILIWLVVAFVSGLIVNNVNVNRINIVFYPMIILCGMGIYWIVKNIRLMGIFLAVLFITAFVSFGASYFGSHGEAIGNAFYNGFGEALDYVEDMDWDRIYITNMTQSENSWWVSEPLTLFHHEIDALYYQGKADARSDSGEKLLPYDDRYKYVQIKELARDPLENAVYIGNIAELGYFEEDKFDIVRFSGYFAAMPAAH